MSTIRILEFLKEWTEANLRAGSNEGGVRPKDIVTQLKIPKSVVNSVLYAALEKGTAEKVQNIPPLWRYKLEDQVLVDKDVSLENSKGGRTLVLVDLGCVHDCVKRAIDLMKYDEDLDVRGYADFNYNGEELSNPKYSDYIQKSPTAESEAADVLMLFDLKDSLPRLNESPHQGGRFNAPQNGQDKRSLVKQVILVSKDKIFSATKTILLTKFPSLSVHLVNNWKDLRVLIE